MAATAIDMTSAADSLVTYDVTQSDIAAVRAQYGGLAANTPEGYEAVRLAIAHVRTTRTAVEKRRVDLKASALSFGRKVDAVAKALTDQLLEIEEPLKAKKAEVDDAKAKAAAEKEAARVAEIEAKLTAERALKEAEERAAREAEDQRLREERARLDAERAKLEEDRRAAEEVERQRQQAARAEREAIEAERRKVEMDRQATERAEFERQAKVDAELRAAEKAERDRRAAEEKRIADAEQAEADRRRLEALRPDVEKINAYAAALRALEAPQLASRTATAALAVAMEDVLGVAASLEAFARANT
ncbi:MAG: hypothetical protein ABJA82_09715 [Myxococcales bacterium]